MITRNSYISGTLKGNHPNNNLENVNFDVFGFEPAGSNMCESKMSESVMISISLIDFYEASSVFSRASPKIPTRINEK